MLCYWKIKLGTYGVNYCSATKVDPGFKGCITLEIINEGEVPIVLYPGIPIAQLVFHEVIGEAEYDGNYSYATGPQFPEFSRKYEKWKFWYKK